MRVSELRNLTRASAVVLLFVGCSASADIPGKPHPGVIEIGQPLADAQAILRERRIKWGEGGFQIARTNNDEENLYCVLDDKSTYAVIFYSRSRKQVTGISMVLYPAGNQSKSTASWKSAKSIRLEPEGGYLVQLLASDKD